MRLFRSFILRQVLLEPLRSGVTITGVSLGVALIVAIQMANASSVAGFEAAIEMLSGKTSL